MSAATINMLEIADEPDAWRDAGFTVDDDGICVVGHVKLLLSGREGGRKRIQSWSLRGIPAGTTSIDGLTTTTSDDPMPETVTHPNGVELIDHLVIASP